MIERKKVQKRLWFRIFVLMITGPFIIAENMIFSLINQRVWDALPMEQSKVFFWGMIFLVYFILIWSLGSFNKKNHIFFAKERACYLKKRVYAQYIRSKKFLYNRNSLSSTINHDIPMLEEEFYYMIISFFLRIGDVLLAFFVTFSVRILYGIFCFIVMGIPILISMKYANTVSDIREKILKEKENYTKFLSEMTQGKPTIRQYRLVNTVLKRHSDLVTQIAQFGAKKREQVMVNMISSQSINRLATEIVSLTGFYLVSQGKLTFGWVMAFNQLSSSMTFSFVEAIQKGIHIYSCLSVRSKILEQYDFPRKSAKRPIYFYSIEQNGKDKDKMGFYRVQQKEEGEVGCQCHIKSCKLGERQIFDNIDFSVAPGEKLLITGENGSGKTTLLKILLGLNQQFEGTVDWIDEKGNQVKEEEKIAYIPQNSFVFQGSVKENILLDQIEEKRWYQKVKEMVSLKIEDNKKIEALQQNISGGEKQKIELARAIYSKRRIFILDEPYSALDQEALLETYLLCDPTKTVIVVSHAKRKETRKLYTRYLVLEEGKVRTVASYN